MRKRRTANPELRIRTSEFGRPPHPTRDDLSHGQLIPPMLSSKPCTTRRSSDSARESSDSRSSRPTARASKKARKPRSRASAVWRLGVPEVYLANLDVNGLGDECIEISQLDQRSFEVAWESLDYVVGNPAYAWAAVVSSEGPAVVGSTRSAAIEAVVQEWGDVQSNVIRLLQTWEGIGRKPSTEWIWPMVVHLLGPDRARDVVARYGAWLLPLES